MENAKCKRRGVSNKNYLRRVVKRPQKRMKKSKGKQNLEPLISRRYKCCKLTAQEPLKEFLMKVERGIDPKFFKEPKKNEDMSKGKTYFRKGKVGMPPGRAAIKVSSTFEDSSSDSSKDFECSLSPISLPRAEDTPPTRTTKLHMGKQLQAFSLKYEAAVGAQILAKLPQNGVLEDALMALRILQTNKRDEEPLSANEMEFLRDDHEEEDYLLPKEPFCENIMEKPLDDLFLADSAHHFPYLTAFDYGDEDERASIELESEDFENPVKELKIATPPIQFYRRNMF